MVPLEAGLSGSHHSSKELELIVYIMQNADEKKGQKTLCSLTTAKKQNYIGI
jgi:hypothetical protein